MAYELYLQGDIEEKEFHAALAEAEKAIADLEWQKMLSAPEDAYGCVIEINAGAGGTEAQDWAAMPGPCVHPLRPEKRLESPNRG